MESGSRRAGGFDDSVRSDTNTGANTGTCTCTCTGTCTCTCTETGPSTERGCGACPAGSNQNATPDTANTRNDFFCLRRLSWHQWRQRR